MSESDVSRLYGELQKVNTRLDNLTELFNHAAHGDGFTRCARHSGRLAAVEEKADLSHVRISGVKKWLLWVLVACASAMANYVWNVVQAAAVKQ